MPSRTCFTACKRLSLDILYNNDWENLTHHAIPATVSSEGIIVKKLLFFLLLIGAAAAGIVVWRYWPPSNHLAENKLQFTRLQYGDMRETVSATGRVEPRETIAVSCEVPGIVTELYGAINKEIAPGDWLAKLDDRKLQLDLEEAASGLAAAEAALEQAMALKDAADLARDYQIDINRKGGFRSELDQAKIKVKAAEAGVKVAASQVKASKTSLKKAEEALAKTLVKLPAHCAGDQTSSPTACRKFFILERHVHIGEFVTPQGPPLFRVTAEFKDMEVHAEVAEADIAKVRVGLQASFSVQSYTDTDVFFKGLVKEIRPQGVNAKGAVYYVVVIDVANEKDPASGEWRLRPA